MMRLRCSAGLWIALVGDLGRGTGLLARLAAHQRRPLCGPGKTKSYKRKPGPAEGTSDGLLRR